MKNSYYFFAVLLLFISCKNERGNVIDEAVEAETEAVSIEEATKEASFTVTPISHATMILEWDGTILYIDPVGGAKAFAGQPEADVVLVTDVHGDHFNAETLQAVASNGVLIIAPAAVSEKMSASMQEHTLPLNNGETIQIDALNGFSFEAIPMYNLREEALKFHPKGRGNGYVIEKDGKRVYISGDTEDISEMRSLENIDVAFVCMNLPYTMTVQKAASAVVDFKPKKVYPYHYRGTNGLSNVGIFSAWIKKSGVGRDIDVVQLDWYPNQ